MHGTTWSRACAYQRADLLNFAAIVQRLHLNLDDKDFPPIRNSVLLFIKGLRTEDNSRIRTLLWAMGLDALLMAGRATCFETRLNNLLEVDRGGVGEVQRVLIHVARNITARKLGREESSRKQRAKKEGSSSVPLILTYFFWVLIHQCLILDQMACAQNTR